MNASLMTTSGVAISMTSSVALPIRAHSSEMPALVIKSA